MSRPILERRNRSVFVLIDRRKMTPKRVAILLGLKYSTVRAIVSRWRRHRVMSHISP